MTKAIIISLAFIAGLALGAVFFGGLWWTVKKGLTAKKPALLFLGSLLLRLAVILCGFYFVGGGQWQRLVACLIGFILARLALTRHFGLPAKQVASNDEKDLKK